MRRSIVVSLVLVALLAQPLPIQAHKGHARPQITRFEFADKPFKAGTSERLIVVAHDPNSWISEIQVQWEDATQSGGVIFAHTYCVQDPEFQTPGTPAKLKLDLEFENATNYHIEARAISEKRCEGGNDTMVSKTLERDLTVRDPTETFADPDDSAGSLNVIGLSQSQRRDETTYRTHVTHGLEFAEELGPSPLSGTSDDVRFMFDTDGTQGSFERVVTVKTAEDGSLHAEMTDGSGTMVGAAAVSFEGSSMSVDFPKRLLGRGVDRYGWIAITRDGSSQACTQSPCTDRAPDSGLLSHQL